MTDQDPAVLLSIDDDGIAEIRFNRPARLNVLDVETANALHDRVVDATADPRVRVIVLSAEGRAFVAGGDLAFMRAAGEQAGQAAQQLIGPIHAALLRLSQAEQPVIASLQGAVAGGGMSIALQADLAIAADDTVMNMAYVKIGNSPDCSGTWTLPRIVGLRKAMEIALLSDPIGADEALRLGLVNRVVPRAELPEQTRALARRLAASAPLALATIKRQLRASLGNTLQQQLDDEQSSFAANAASADFREALNAFFEKRKPKFSGQ